MGTGNDIQFYRLLGILNSLNGWMQDVYWPSLRDSILVPLSQVVLPPQSLALESETIPETEESGPLSEFEGPSLCFR